MKNRLFLAFAAILFTAIIVFNINLAQQGTAGDITLVGVELEAGANEGTVDHIQDPILQHMNAEMRIIGGIKADGRIIFELGFALHHHVPENMLGIGLTQAWEVALFMITSHKLF